MVYTKWHSHKTSSKKLLLDHTGGILLSAAAIETTLKNYIGNSTNEPKPRNKSIKFILVCQWIMTRLETAMKKTRVLIIRRDEKPSILHSKFHIWMGINQSQWPSLAFRTVEEGFRKSQCQDEPLLSADLQISTKPTTSVHLISNLWDFYFQQSFFKVQKTLNI